MLHKKIKQRRIELNMSQDDLARRTGYKTKSAISRIERGERDITQSQIELFAKALETTPSYLMGWDSEDKLNKEDEKLLNAFNQLNNEGQEKAISYTQDLVDSGKYKKTIKEDTSDYITTIDDMRSYLMTIPMAAFDGKLNPVQMNDEEIISLYKLLKDNE
ncbi:helix-turn-helix transcriptional regulator [uncultured Anaerococcus sp.]|uniref:helix-turn-helix domain-containing protein n=1 Tax=uncultured Anaerococcus sp. TaxID=293428 RepID=UPI002889B459|nr:helix-turn-helix transcriptional regulator [uncultured Anaerococcus sp.]